jgi:hypothetical protein
VAFLDFGLPILIKSKNVIQVRHKHWPKAGPYDAYNFFFLIFYVFCRGDMAYFILYKVHVIVNFILYF